MNPLETERAELNYFTEGVRAETARSLELLRAIESTLTWLERMTSQLRADVVFAEKMNAKLHEVSGVIDPEGKIHDALEAAQDAVNRLYEVLITKRQHGRDDHQLTDEDGIEAAYTEAIAQSADLHNAINSLRWNIGEHDIDAVPNPHSKSYGANDIDRMFDDMLAS